VPGIVFLSGGQSAEHATAHLNAMNAMGESPWQLSFSFARALQGPVLAAWRGNPAKVPAAQQCFYQRAACNSAARYGKYTQDMKGAVA
jgi:fructose-bisphosphate aldolase class I